MKIIRAVEFDANASVYRQQGTTEQVRGIIQDVGRNGNSAVRKYANRFDGEAPKSFEITRKQIRQAYGQVDAKTASALRKAAQNIRGFAKEQFKGIRDFEVERNGVLLGQRIVPIGKVGCYVPGGRYPLPSTALMCVIPAKVAGVDEVIVCSPKIKPVTVVAADIAGADRIFSVGGVQAIASMAYGTETIPRVDKIVGPGNRFVAAAKKEVYGQVGIDFIAGPSEVLVVADGSGDAELIAADLLAQAEHDVEARPNLITTSLSLARAVNKELERQLKTLGTRKIAGEALKNGRIIIVKSLSEAVGLSDLMAPEHLELQVQRPEGIARKFRNYGSLFIGRYSAEVFGDYCSGTNHSLPTSGAARYTGGLSVKEFVKVLTWQKISKEGSRKMARIAGRLAKIEGLEAHKRAAEARERR